MTSSPDNFWCLSKEALFERTQSRATGLTSAEAEERIRRFGPNRVGDQPTAAKIWRRFSEPLVAILLIAAVVAGFTGDLASLSLIHI